MAHAKLRSTTHRRGSNKGDATKLPFSDAEFDLIYCRFLLEYLSRKDEAIAEMVRVCRLGGRVFLQDLDGQLVWHYPTDKELETQLGIVLAELGQTGFDPFVGRKLYFLTRKAGLTDIRVQAESYHLYAGRIGQETARLWELKLDIALPIAAKALGSHIAASKLKDRFLAYLQHDDTLTYSVVFSVTGTKSVDNHGTLNSGSAEERCVDTN